MSHGDAGHGPGALALVPHHEGRARRARHLERRVADRVAQARDVVAALDALGRSRQQLRFPTVLPRFPSIAEQAQQRAQPRRVRRQVMPNGRREPAPVGGVERERAAGTVVVRRAHGRDDESRRVGVLIGRHDPLLDAPFHERVRRRIGTALPLGGGRHREQRTRGPFVDAQPQRHLVRAQRLLGIGEQPLDHVALDGATQGMVAHEAFDGWRARRQRQSGIVAAPRIRIAGMRRLVGDETRRGTGGEQHHQPLPPCTRRERGEERVEVHQDGERCDRDGDRVETAGPPGQHGDETCQERRDRGSRRARGKDGQRDRECERADARRHVSLGGLSRRMWCGLWVRRA